ncbi:hypothetical protein DIPPA_08811 [Diplonema papillatum]|nr:hypothetical protein DIPPA_08811 [Diplonema papillatum]
MTICATCVTVAECCGGSHHGCLDHDMPACEDCKRISDLRNRRPGPAANEATNTAIRYCNEANNSAAESARIRQRLTHPGLNRRSRGTSATRTLQQSSETGNDHRAKPNHASRRPHESAANSTPERGRAGAGPGPANYAVTSKEGISAEAKTRDDDPPTEEEVPSATRKSEGKGRTRVAGKSRREGAIVARPVEGAVGASQVRVHRSAIYKQTHGPSQGLPSKRAGRGRVGAVCSGRRGQCRRRRDRRVVVVVRAARLRERPWGCITQPMHLDEQSKGKRGTKRAPERDDQDELKRRKHDTSRAKR